MTDSSFSRARPPKVVSWLQLLLCSAAWIFGCNAATDEGKTGSETNWLSKCALDSDCKVGTCLCGACNVACTTSAECAGLPAPAACALASVAAFPSSCPAGGQPSGVCLPTCDAQTPCPSGQVCDSGWCAPQSTAPSSVPVPLQDFVTAFCAAARSCCGAQGLSLIPLADCESYLTTSVNPLELDQLYLPTELEPHKFVTLYQQQTISVDAAALAACAAALRDSASTCAAQPVRLCASAFHGTQAVGAPCRLVEECAQPSNGDAVFCVRPEPTGTVSASVGTCTLAAHGQANDDCRSSCAADGVCVGQSSTVNVGNPSAPPTLTACYLADGLRCGAGCQPPKLAGDACSEASECADGLTCGSELVCIAPIALGGPCSLGVDCADGLECDSGACANRSFGSATLCAGTYDL